jgi:3-oxo-5-alpha-steroid 4-dehydrogenase 1
MIEKFVMIWILFGIILFPIQFYISAPYGRHTKQSFGPLISNKLGWIIMESWALLTFVLVYYKYFNTNFYSLFFGIIYALHYVNRGIIYPLKTKTNGKKIPLLVSIFAMTFNSVNAGLNAYFLGKICTYPNNYFLHWNFILGLFLFILGFYINYKSDNILIELRAPGETGYKIPNGFLFKYISCPNHFGEIVEWLGYFLMTNNLASLSFIIWTIANLLPRAVHHHKWYIENFKAYPKDRKIIFPKIY